MREIKFRVWDIRLGSMSPPVDLIRMLDSHANTGIKASRWPDRIYLQYTGLKDKNGVEIFEGDILSDGSGFLARVIYHQAEARFGFSVTNDRYPGVMYAGSMLKCQVIGNRYENPELLAQPAQESNGEERK